MRPLLRAPVARPSAPARLALRALALAAPLLLPACGDKDEACATAGDMACEGDVLLVCSDDLRLVEEQDCEAEGMICRDMGADSHCMADDDMDMRR